MKGSHRHATVNGKNLPGDVARLVGAEESDADDDRVTACVGVAAAEDDEHAKAVDVRAGVALALVGSDAFTLREVFPAAVIVEPDAAVGIPVDVMRRVLRRAKSAGVGLQVIDVPAGATFAFSTSMMRVQTDASRGFSDTTQAAGGVLVGVM